MDVSRPGFFYVLITKTIFFGIRKILPFSFSKNIRGGVKHVKLFSAAGHVCNLVTLCVVAERKRLMERWKIILGVVTWRAHFIWTNPTYRQLWLFFVYKEMFIFMFFKSVVKRGHKSHFYSLMVKKHFRHWKIAFLILCLFN